MNNNFANAIGAAIVPEEESKELRLARSIVAPSSEIVKVDNADLPNMSDIDAKLATGEHQLEELIVRGLEQTIAMFKEAENVAPDKRARFLEVAQMTYSQTLAAIVHKNNLQLEKRKIRVKEDSYKKEGSSNGNIINNIQMTREDVLKMLSNESK